MGQGWVASAFEFLFYCTSIQFHAIQPVFRHILFTLSLLAPEYLTGTGFHLDHRTF
jgi:hypothetical protein